MPAHIDAFITHNLDGLPEDAHIPALLQVSSASWMPAPGLAITITSRLGNIVSCSFTAAALKILEQDPGVISIEASRPGASR